MTTSDWAITEFEGLELGDKRRDERLTKIAGQFMASTESPINKACGSWCETKAAYRFFQNDNVDYRDIVKHHSTVTRNRAKKKRWSWPYRTPLISITLITQKQRV